jgi:hypothetical protein
MPQVPTYFWVPFDMVVGIAGGDYAIRRAGKWKMQRY